MSVINPKITEIVVDGETYVRKSSIHQNVHNIDGLPYVILRTRSGGVHAGYLKSKNGQNAILLNSRNLWYWSGATSLNQLSQEGVTKVASCKFTQEIPELELDEVLAVYKVSSVAKANIDTVPVWRV